MTPRGTYKTIAEELRRRITRGDLAAGSMLPSEMALVAEHGVARGTVRSALALLEAEGLIEPVPGQGRRVTGLVVEGPPNTAYGRVAAELLRLLEAGNPKDDERLPSESQLIQEFGVSRNTVRRAYRLLVESGRVVIKPGSGAYRRTD